MLPGQGDRAAPVRARGMRPNSMISRPQDGRAAPEAVPGGGQGGLLRRPLGERPGEPVHPPARLALCGGPHQPGLARHGAEVHAGDRLPAHGGCRAPGGVAWLAGSPAQVSPGPRGGGQGRGRREGEGRGSGKQRRSEVGQMRRQHPCLSCDGGIGF